MGRSASDEAVRESADSSASPGLATDLLEIRQLSHRYESKNGTVLACEIDHMTIQAGEFCVFLGPSGCGKSTLLRLIAGLIKPSSGTIAIGGRPIEGPGADRGLVFQQPALFPWLSIVENVKFGPRVQGMDPKESHERALAMLDLVGLREVADRQTWELSGGMQQRVSVARVLVNHPATMLMDEPLSALDEVTREQLQEVLLGIWERTGQTIIFVTHNIDEALRIGTRVIMMSKRPGRVVADLSIPFTTEERRDSVSLRDTETYRRLRRDLAKELLG